MPGGRLSYVSDYDGGYALGPANFTTAPDLILGGVKTDSLGDIETSTAWDPFAVDLNDLRDAVEANGYWRTSDGRHVTVYEEYVSDRVTGELIKTSVFVEIPPERGVEKGLFTKGPATFNGLLNDDNLGPVARDDSASVRPGEAVVIDVLGNDDDPDGDAINLDGLVAGDGLVVDNGDGTVTYFADQGFNETDVFHYFIGDENGAFAMASVTVTPDI